MKNLANCTPTELLKQAVRIREPLRSWLEATGAKEIRARRPDGMALPEDPSEWTEEQRAALMKQARENTRDIVAAALEKDFEGTVNLMCLATFTERDDFDDHSLSEYIDAINEIMKSGEVRDFFTLYL